MTYDAPLAQRLRPLVAVTAAGLGLPVDERRMFGGLAFMVGGKMACGVVGTDLMARVGPARYAEALGREHVREMDFTGRPMTGYVFVSVGGLVDDSQLADWVDQAVSHVVSLARPGCSAPMSGV